MRQTCRSSCVCVCALACTYLIQTGLVEGLAATRVVAHLIRDGGLQSIGITDATLCAEALHTQEHVTHDTADTTPQPSIMSAACFFFFYPKNKQTKKRRRQKGRISSYVLRCLYFTHTNCNFRQDFCIAEPRSV